MVHYVAFPPCFRNEEESILSQDPRIIPADLLAITAPDVGSSAGSARARPGVFYGNGNSDHMIVGSGNYVSFEDEETKVAAPANGIVISKRKINAIELPTLQKRIRHAS